MMNALHNTVLAAVVIVLTAYVGPALDAADQVAQEARAKQRMAQRESTARQRCGENAAYRIERTTLICFTKRGHKTSTSQL